MALSYKSIRSKVHKKIKVETVTDMKKVVKACKKSLWGLEKPRHFESKMLYVALYKDMTGVGYIELSHMVRSWLKISKNSLVHNVRVIRKYGARWGRTKVERGDAIGWNRLLRNTRFKGPTKYVNLWIDSVDLPLTKRHIEQGDTTLWSKKEDAFGQRFTALSDYQGRIRRLWGGYSPKVGDSQFMSLYRQELEQDFNGGVIIADCGYERAKKIISNPAFVVPHSLPKGRPSKKDGKGIRQLTAKQERENRVIRKVRARVESPFAHIRSMFKALDNKFDEPHKEHNRLVEMAVGIHNFQISSR